MIIADSSVWIEYLNNVDSEKTKALENALLANNVIIGDLIITEVLQGIRNDGKYEAVKKMFCGLDYHTIVDKDLSVKAAQNYRLLRRKGVTIRKTIDVLIGTFCLEYGYPILHKDQDFDFMEHYLGLKVVK